jgi:glycosyltransferase involved in cell wall biosynthesis
MKILFISTWFPYPPDQGSKIRAYHLLRALAAQHEVSLISFKDRDLQRAVIDPIERLCTQVRVIDEEPFAQSLLGRVFGWFSPQPRAVVGGFSTMMAEEVERQVRQWQPDVVIALTYVAAMYAKHIKAAVLIADVDNLLSLMLLEEYEGSDNWMRKIRRQLAFRKFLRFERELYSQYDLNLVTSERDAQRIRDYIPLSDEQVLVVPNGVDVIRFQPGLYNPQPGSMVFNGALSYEPNYDAMILFLNEIYPRIKAQIPGATLSITGSTSNVDLDPIPLHEGVKLTGYVEDIRQVVARSSVCVVPLRKGAGTRLKILEAMALGVPVVTTSKGAEGLCVVSGKHLLIADSADDFASATIQLLNDENLRGRIVTNAMELVREHYDWESIGINFVTAVETLSAEEYDVN